MSIFSFNLKTFKNVMLLLNIYIHYFNTLPDSAVNYQFCFRAIFLPAEKLTSLQLNYCTLKFKSGEKKRNVS